MSAERPHAAMQETPPALSLLVQWDGPLADGFVVEDLRSGHRQHFSSRAEVLRRLADALSATCTGSSCLAYPRPGNQEERS